MTHDKPIERAFLAQDLAVMCLSLWSSARAHALVIRHVPILRAPVGIESYVSLLLIFVPVWFWLVERAGLHLVRTLTGPPLEIVRKLLWMQAKAIVAIGVILVAAQVSLNRALIGIFLVFSSVLFTWSLVLQQRWTRRHYGEAVALVVGPAADGLIREFEQSRRRRIDHLPTATLELLRARLRGGPVDEVVLSSDIPRPVLHQLVAACQDAGIPALVRLERADLELVRPESELIGAGLYLAYQRREPARATLVIKALLDRAVAALALLLGAPLLAVVALLIRIKLGRPVLFIQQRAGLNGRPFAMLKFRTMYEGAERERGQLLGKNEMDGPVFKMKDDPRVTPLGRVLRRTSLDELPQLVNVLLGHMSLVGPRPLPLLESGEIDGAHRRRLSMRPGITGLWQVSGRNAIPFAEWMAMDLTYVDDWSLGLDLSILLRTVPAILGRKGAV